MLHRSDLPDKLKKALRHLSFGLLLGFGLSMALLGCLGLSNQTGVLLLVLLVTDIALAVSSLLSPILRGLTGLVILLFGFFACIGFQPENVNQLLFALQLAAQGQWDALPLVAFQLSAVIGLLFALLTWLMTIQDLGCFPALTGVVLVMALLWLRGSEQLIWYCLPAVIALLLMQTAGRDESIQLRTALPVAAALALLVFVLTPSGGVTIAPLKEKAEELRQQIMDYLFFTEPRDVFSISADGYYPMGQNQLGGPAQPSERLVMLVKTPATVYLRGAIRNEYTGRSWRDTTGGRRYLWVSSAWANHRREIFNEGLPSGGLSGSTTLLKAQDVAIHMLSGAASSLFVPQRVRELSTGGDLVPYFNNGSEIFATRNLQEGDTYTVSAPLAVAGDSGLDIIITACKDLPSDEYAAIETVYTALPDHLEQMVYDLAAEITAGASTPYEKALAIRNYLLRSYRYSLEPQDSPEYDFVTSFLFHTHEGYCTHFASAMTVLCRMAGLPARYIEGYLARPDANGDAYVTGLNAHAWTEVYLKGYGWLTFDATPATDPDEPPRGEDDDHGDNDNETPPTPTPALPEGIATPTPPPDAPDTDPQNDQPPETSPDPQTDPRSNEPAPDTPPDEPPSSDFSALWWFLLLLLLAALIFAIVYRIRTTAPAAAAARASDPLAAFEAWTQGVWDILAIRKLTRAPGESPIAFMKRCDESRMCGMALAPIGDCISVVFYGHMTPMDEEIAYVRGCYEALASTLKRTERVKLLWRRCTVPLKRRSYHIT